MGWVWGGVSPLAALFLLGRSIPPFPVYGFQVRLEYTPFGAAKAFSPPSIFLFLPAVCLYLSLLVGRVYIGIRGKGGVIGYIFPLLGFFGPFPYMGSGR